MICLQEISEINSKPSARYALALFSLCQESKTDNEIEKYVLNLLEILKSDNGKIEVNAIYGSKGGKKLNPAYTNNSFCSIHSQMMVDITLHILINNIS